MKTNFKRFLALALGGIMLFTACSNGGDKKGEDTGDTAWAAEGVKAEIVVQVEKDWMDVYQKAADKVLEKNPDSKIEFKEIGSFDHLDILKSTDATNPDFAYVFALPLDRFTDLVSQDVLGAMDAPAMAKEMGGYDDFDKSLGYEGKEVYVGIRSERFLAKKSDYNSFAATIDVIEMLGKEKLLHIRTDKGQELVVSEPGHYLYEPDEIHNFTFDTEALHFFDAKTTERIN